MKKSLFAAAALTAIAGAAQAQSSVTVYGILDVGYVGSNAREVGATASGASSQGNINKIQKSAFTSGAEQTSRLGFKGNEDLGGGKSAFFTVEMGLIPTNPSLSGGTARDTIQQNNNASGTAIDNRQSFVGIKQNGVGQFAIGRQYTPIFNAGAVTDPGAYNNVAGNVIYNSGSVYTADSFTSGTNNNVGFTNRASNALTVDSDSFAGFKVHGMYALSNQNATIGGGNYAVSSTGGNTNWNGWGLGADYTWNKLFVTAAYQSFKTQYTNVIYSGSTPAVLGFQGVTSAVLAGASGTVIFNPTQTADKQTYVGATYDFGILKAYAQWVGRKVQNDITATASGAGAASFAGQQLNRNAQQIGVRSYITPAIEAWGSVGTGRYKGAPISATQENGTINFVGWQLGSNYYLSKRTNVYAIYGQQQSTSTTQGVVGSGNSANQYALGLRHTF